MPIVAVEIEISLQAYETQTKDGGYRNLISRRGRHSPFIGSLQIPVSVIATCKELGITTIGYSYALPSQSLSSPHS